MAYIKTSGKILVRGRIFFPPFLAHNQIRRKRFCEVVIIRNGKRIVRKYAEAHKMNDKWWEWEHELGLTPDRSRELNEVERSYNSAPHRGHQFADTDEQIYNHRCNMCGHEWTGILDPQKCPDCRSRRWKGGR